MSGSRLRMARSWLVLVGTVLTASALLGIGVQEVIVARSGALDVLTDDTLVVAAFVTTTISAGAVVVTVDRIVDGSGSTLPEPDASPDAPRVGSDVDAIVRWRLPDGYRSPAERRRLRERLSGTAVETIRRTATVSNRRAEELVERGEWTDDAVAAAFLGRPAAPRRVRICDRVASQVAFEHRVTRTTRAIVAFANEREDE